MKSAFHQRCRKGGLNRSLLRSGCLGALLGMLFGHAHGADPGPVTQTEYGPVRGVLANELAIYRGIPFVAPPVGARRFLPPAPPSAWSTPRDATAFGPACMQLPDKEEIDPGTPMSEDCLTLNVWAPASTGGAPVLVFIHGGGFVSGTTRNPEYDGAALARRGLVVVSITYRLGPFGWLDLSSIGPAYAQSMNNGLLDQMAALGWVRRNISSFGGDAHNVTLVGESAGAMSISALMAAPQADGLYDKAILESGATDALASRAWAQRVTQKMVKFTGVANPSRLLHLSAEQLLAGADKLYDTELSDTAFHPVVDGSLVPQPPFMRIAAEQGPSVPVIIGTTLDEARYWLYYLPEIDRLPTRYYSPWLSAITGPKSTNVIAAYRRERPQLDDSQLGMALAGDVSFRMPAIRMAEDFARRGVKVWMYLATVSSPQFQGRMGAAHSIELPFVFGTYADPSLRDFVGLDRRNPALADAVQRLWASFCTGGSPRTSALTWPNYDLQQRATLMLDHDLRVEHDPYPLTRHAWDGLTFNTHDPGLERLTPLQFQGTPKYDLLVLAVVVGWPRIGLGIFGVVLAVSLVVVGGRAASRRRHTR